MERPTGVKRPPTATPLQEHPLAQEARVASLHRLRRVPKPRIPDTGPGVHGTGTDMEG